MQAFSQQEVPCHANSTEASSRGERATMVKDRDLSTTTSAGCLAKEEDAETKLDIFMKRVCGENDELQRMLKVRLETRGPEEGGIPRERGTGHREQEQRSQDAEPGRKREARPSGERCKWKEARGSGWLSMLVRDRQNLRAGHRNELDADARGRPVFGAGSPVGELHNGESAQNVSFPRFETTDRIIHEGQPSWM